MNKYGPETASEAVKLWDAGEVLTSINLGGLGPGYDQAIQVLIFAILRKLHDQKLPPRDEEIVALVQKTINELIDGKDLGYSGAQGGAAASIAWRYLSRGYNTTLNAAPFDNLIQVSKHFPEPL